MIFAFHVLLYLYKEDFVKNELILRKDRHKGKSREYRPGESTETIGKTLAKKARDYRSEASDT